MYTPLVVIRASVGNSPRQFGMIIPLKPLVPSIHRESTLQLPTSINESEFMKKYGGNQQPENAGVAATKEVPGINRLVYVLSLPTSCDISRTHILHMNIAVAASTDARYNPADDPYRIESTDIPRQIAVTSYTFDIVNFASDYKWRTSTS